MSRPRNSKGRWISDKDIKRRRQMMLAAAAIGAAAMWVATTGF